MRNLPTCVKCGADISTEITSSHLPGSGIWCQTHFEEYHKKPLADILKTKKSTWGVSGIRYDEACEQCGRTGTVDNNSGCCQRCHGIEKHVQSVCAEPYRRGIGQGFGPTEDGEV